MTQLDSSQSSSTHRRIPLPELLERLHGGLIVSCQAEADEPLHGSQIMAVMARAAMQGGAVGIRANGPEDIAAIKLVVSLPLIGIFKDDIPGYSIRITPTIEHARLVARAGADIIAIDATARPNPDKLSLPQRIKQIVEETGLPVMADISTLEEGIAAESAGASLVGTTLSGYTPYSTQQEGPDFELISQLARAISIPIVAEGRIWTPEEAAQALAAGAFTVTVGGAITRPQNITSRFVRGIRQAH